MTAMRDDALLPFGRGCAAWWLTRACLGPPLLRVGVVYENRPGRVAQHERLPILVERRPTAPLEILPYAWWVL